MYIYLISGANISYILLAFPAGNFSHSLEVSPLETVVHVDHTEVQVDLDEMRQLRQYNYHGDVMHHRILQPRTCLLVHIGLFPGWPASHRSETYMCKVQFPQRSVLPFIGTKTGRNKITHAEFMK